MSANNFDSKCTLETHIFTQFYILHKEQLQHKIIITTTKEKQNYDLSVKNITVQLPRNTLKLYVHDIDRELLQTIMARSKMNLLVFLFVPNFQ